jgi:signal transduction histidine kinase
MSIALRPTDAVEVVTTTAEGFRPAAARNGIDIALRVAGATDADADALAGSASANPTTAPPALPPVAADPDRLAQMVANLIENACTYARSRVTVGLADAGPSGGCIITVDDNGPGIAPSDLERVFERFYQADRGRSRVMGSGLGLAIVAELATAMGGRVRAVSPFGPDGGSRFEVWLRPWTAPAPEMGTPATPAPAAPRA